MEGETAENTPWLFITVTFVTTLYGIYSYFLKPRMAIAYTNIYSRPGWMFYLKQLWIWGVILRYRLRRKKRKQWQDVCEIVPLEEDVDLEKIRDVKEEHGSDGLKIIGVDQDGNNFIFRICKYYRHREMWLQIRSQDGSLYQLPDVKFRIETNDNVNDHWECGGLKIQVLHPMKRMRVLFNGLLLKKTVDGGKSLHHVRFNFIWASTREHVDVQSNWSPQLLSEALAREAWKRKEWFHWVKDQGSGYEQWGAMCGELVIDGGVTELNMASLRQRRYGLTKHKTLQRLVTLTGFTYDGALFTIRASCNPLGLTHAKFGHIQLPNTLIYPIDQCDISLPHLAEHQSSPLPSSISVTFTANSRTFSATIKLNNHLNKSDIRGQRYLLKMISTSVLLNGDAGYGTAEFWYRINEDPGTTYKHNILPRISQKEMKRVQVCSLTNKLSVLPELTGGKGASLGKLAGLTGQNFKVSPGFCITVHGFDSHLQSRPNIQQEIDNLTLLKGCEFQEQCSKIVKLLEDSEINSELEKEILSEWKTLGGDSTSVAVRSSAVGEDSQDLSAAGQNETFLGVKGRTELLKAVRKCWASLYAFRSVEYRRQHGQPIKSSMAVVVQVMVPADKAGVLFSRNPVTGDPRQIELSANYGLGESVVSAEVDPDRIEVEKLEDGSLKIKTKEKGLKQHKILLTEDGTGTIKQESSDAPNICLADDEILRLGNIACTIEVDFDNKALDIEWAIVGNDIYLLQARPITTLDQWTDYELTHELDTPIVSQIETITFANTGEVLPGAGSALSESIFFEVLNKGMPVKYGPNIVLTQHHWAINVFNALLRDPGSNVNVFNKVIDLAIYGHPVTDVKMLNNAVRRNGLSVGYEKFKNLMERLKVMLKTNSKTKEAHYLAEHFRFDLVKFSTSQELFSEITTHMPILTKVSGCHAYSSQTSVFFQMIAMSVLLEGSKEFKTEHFTDISLLFSVCSDVLSADIPASLKKLSLLIAECDNAEEFVEISPSEGYSWIERNHKSALAEYHRFMKKHGHRGIREFDVMDDVWATNPERLIATLQNLVKPYLNSDTKTLAYENKPQLTPQEVADKLQSPVKPNTRTILKYIVYKCRRAVANREETKGAFVCLIHQFRLAYRKLSQLLVDEGFLPQSDLLFHLTHYEIGELIKTRNPSLVMKASRRKRLWPIWNKLKFQEVVTGIPKPIEEKSKEWMTGIAKCHGTPVYPGNALGRACVISDITEIDQLKEGDILITHSTDVGWSPYFPLISGIVTELGGLISHGAVVAREYGLPCVIGAENALQYFKTGDTVLLSGSQGTVVKVVEPISEPA